MRKNQACLYTERKNLLIIQGIPLYPCFIPWCVLYPCPLDPPLTTIFWPTIDFCFFQIKHISAVKFHRGYKTNMSFHLISKSQKVLKNETIWSRLCFSVNSWSLAVILPNHPSQKRISLSVRKKYASNTFSDHMALLRAFQAWQRARSDGWEKVFCERNFLSQATLEMIVGMRWVG